MALGLVVLLDGHHVTVDADPRPRAVTAIALEVATRLDEPTLVARLG
jgi:hypothetical protein